MAMVGPGGGWKAFAVFALATAFASATQDIVADAWRIESAESDEEQGLLTSAFQLGYRAALLFADSLILFLAARIGWVNSYVVVRAGDGRGAGRDLRGHRAFADRRPATQAASGRWRPSGACAASSTRWWARSSPSSSSTASWPCSCSPR